MTSSDITDLAGHRHQHQHRLWWTPGTRGRGVLFESGLVCTWPEGDATHRQWAEQVPSRPVMFFYIRPGGRVRIPERHAARAPQLIAALRAADRRLAPFAPPSHARPATAHPAPHPAERHSCPASPLSPPASGRDHGARHSVDRAWNAGIAERLARIQRRY